MLAFGSGLVERARNAAEKLTQEEDSQALEPLSRGITTIGGSLLANPARLEELALAYAARFAVSAAMLVPSLAA